MLLLFVRTSSSTIPVELPVDATVNDIRVAVHAAGGPPVRSQQLSFQGETLNVSAAISDTRLSMEAVLEVTRRDGGMLSAGHGQAIAVLEGGDVCCWPDRSHSPSWKGLYTHVSAGHRFSAAIVDGRLHTWDREEGAGRAPAVPDCLMRTCSASAYSMQMGAIDHDDRLHLFHSPFEKEVDGVEGVADVSCGDHHMLLLMRDGRVLGYSAAPLPADHGQGTVPDFGGRRAVAISCGRHHNAVLLEDGQLVCFGKQEGGRCEVPHGLTGIREVSCGGSCTAVLTGDGDLVTVGTQSVSCSLATEERDLATVSAGWGVLVAATRSGRILGSARVIPEASGLRDCRLAM